MNAHELIKKSLKLPIIPLIIIPDENDILPLADILKDHFSVLEVLLRTPVALKAIEILKKAMPKLVVAAGTINNVSQLRAAKDSGADFIVSPGFTESLLRTAQKENMPYLPGVLTPVEISLAMEYGCTALKLFPAPPAQGPASMKEFAGVQFCPSSLGINEDNMLDYLALDNVLAVPSIWMTLPDLVKNREWKKIKGLVEKTVKKLGEAE